MKKRCYDVNNADYANYGGRGIKVCERWLDFHSFILDMGFKPTPMHSLDRYPDKNGDYEPLNCRWASPLEQANNTRQTRAIPFENGFASAHHIARVLGISPQTVLNRINKGKDVYGKPNR